MDDLKCEETKVAESRSTSVDTGFVSFKRSYYNKSNLRKYYSEERVDNLGCYPVRVNASDAIYPVISKKLVLEHEGTYTKEKDRRSFMQPRQMNPNAYMTLHKVITVGRYYVYYFGTEKSSGKPKTVKIFRPKGLSLGKDRAGLEKQILSLNDKPRTLPALQFAFRYEIYKCLVLEPLYNESLGEKLLHARRLMPAVVKSFMVDIVSAVSFLHTKRIIHRNLTLDSFWVQANRRLKLTNFDYCANKRGLSRFSTIFRVKPTNFTAPELFSCKPYSRQTDIWAMGIIFYRMLSGRFPFYGESSRNLKMKILTTQQSYPEFFSPESISLCSDMLAKDPLLRLGHTIKTEWAFAEHTYFKGVDWDEVCRFNLPGPSIKWKFPVAKDMKEIGRVASKSIVPYDLETFDVSKMRMKPLRMDAIRHGTHNFSPEYLEQHFPHKLTTDAEIEERSATKRSRPKSTSAARPSFARRFSLRFNLLQAFRDLEDEMGKDNEDDDEAIQEYVKSISENINRYALEKTNSRIKLANENMESIKEESIVTRTTHSSV